MTDILSNSPLDFALLFFDDLPLLPLLLLLFPDAVLCGELELFLADLSGDFEDFLLLFPSLLPALAFRGGDREGVRPEGAVFGDFADISPEGRWNWGQISVVSLYSLP